MSAVPFPDLPDHARLWVFASPRPLSGREAETLLTQVDRFIDSWLAHGREVRGGRDLRYDRFLLVAADEAATGVSGCSIDSLFHTLQQLECEMGVRLLDSSAVWFRAEDGEIHHATRPEFRERVRAGTVDENTVVFNNTVRSVGELREGRWEAPARESWHAQAFRMGAVESRP